MVEQTESDEINFNEINNKCKILIKEAKNIPNFKTQQIIDKKDFNSVNIQTTIEYLDFQSEILIVDL